MSQAPTKEARFVTGSTMRHVVVMTFTGALGLMSMFLVDLADLFYLSLLGKTEITAAIGYAGTIVFTNLSLCIGTGIAAAVLVARNLGAKKPERAREFATSSLIYSPSSRPASLSSSPLPPTGSCACSAPKAKRWPLPSSSSGSLRPASSSSPAVWPAPSSCGASAMPGAPCM